MLLSWLLFFMRLAVCKTLSDKSLTVILQYKQVSFGCKFNNIYHKFKIFKHVIKHILTVCLQSIFAFIVWAIPHAKGMSLHSEMHWQKSSCGSSLSESEEPQLFFSSFYRGAGLRHQWRPAKAGSLARSHWAIWTALRAAPFLIWSPTTQKLSPQSSQRSLRMRPT